MLYDGKRTDDADCESGEEDELHSPGTRGAYTPNSPRINVAFRKVREGGNEGKVEGYSPELQRWVRSCG